MCLLRNIFWILSFFPKIFCFKNAKKKSLLIPGNTKQKKNIKHNDLNYKKSEKIKNIKNQCENEKKEESFKIKKQKYIKRKKYIKPGLKIVIPKNFTGDIYFPEKLTPKNFYSEFY